MSFVQVQYAQYDSAIVRWYNRDRFMSRDSSVSSMTSASFVILRHHTSRSHHHPPSLSRSIHIDTFDVESSFDPSTLHHPSSTSHHRPHVTLPATKLEASQYQSRSPCPPPPRSPSCSRTTCSSLAMRPTLLPSRAVSLTPSLVYFLNRCH